jgi:hypothetical protein
LLKLVESWGELDETLKPSAHKLLELEAWCHVSCGAAWGNPLVWWHCDFFVLKNLEQKLKAQNLLTWSFHEAWCHVSWGLAGALCWCIMVV